jgi:hypothetical protein
MCARNIRFPAHADQSPNPRNPLRIISAAGGSVIERNKRHNDAVEE